MSAAEVTAAPEVAPSPAAAGRTRPVRGSWLRLFRSELVLVYGRRRNWVGAAVLAAVPVIIALSIRLSQSQEADTFLFGQIPVNGLFVALAALFVELPLFLPIAVATIAGDSVAGEANLGTLRYLLVVPVDRTRLLSVKLAVIAVFTASATLLVALVGAVLGVALFGGGDLPTLSGTTLGFAEGVGRLLLVCAYLTVCLVALGTIGLFVSTLTEQPLGATIAVLVIALASQIMDAIPQLSAIHEYLPTHWWAAFGEILRDPPAWDGLLPGLASAAAYTAVFATAAWARFTTRDVSS